MDPRTKSSLLWGVIAALAFLVGYQGLLLAGQDGIDLPAVAGVTVVVFVAATGLSYTLDRRLPAGGGRS